MRALVVIPTDNAVATLESTLRRVRADLPDADVLVVDDASRDGTADLAEKVGDGLGQIEVLRRPAAGQRLDPAPLAGYRVALARGYDLVVEVDPADPSSRRSHPADVLRRADLVSLGSGPFARWRWRAALARRVRKA